MNKAGVNIVCGTDAGIGITAPGYSIHQELALYKEAGLSNYEVLKTATINPSKTHKVLNRIGSVALGKTANFIISSENPLDNLLTLSKPEWIMIEGRIINKGKLSNFISSAKNRKTLVTTAIHYAEYLLIEK